MGISGRRVEGDGKGVAMKPKILKEADLASNVIDWLEQQHWDVYQEVKFSKYYGSIADIVAVRAGYVWVIECKTSMTLTVMRQANQWRAHFRSIAVPPARTRDDRDFAYHLARDYFKLGVIEVYDKYTIHERQSPPLMREFHEFAKWKISNLCDEQKHYAKAGTNGGGYFTPYRSTMNDVQRYIRNNPGCTLKEIMSNLQTHHYSSNATARSSIRVALSNWENDWCEVKTDDGKEYRYYIRMKGG